MKAELKRKFLIVSANKSNFIKFEKLLQKHVKGAFCLPAHDGAEAIRKIQNDVPDVVITDVSLAKTNGIELTRWILEKKSGLKLAVILLAEVPDHDHFVDAVVTSQVQFLNPRSDDLTVLKSVSKSLNFVSHSIPQEFYLKFLAPGDQLIKKGDTADAVYLVKTGELVATTASRDGAPVTLGRIVSGEFVGEMAYINGEMRSADVYAETDCELIEIPVGVLDHVLFTKPAWSKALMVTLSKRVKRANELSTK